MQTPESRFVKEKAEYRFLSLVFENGEEILPNFFRALKDNNIQECTVAEGSGSIREAEMNYFQGSAYKRRKSFGDEKVTAASGKFHSEKDKWIGDLHVVVARGNQRINGTLLKGKAAGEFRLTAKFAVMVAENSGENGPISEGNPAISDAKSGNTLNSPNA
ncbi:MAG: DUF296 domain-containing protein [Candidatus Diapherotrites archaeon]